MDRILKSTIEKLNGQVHKIRGVRVLLDGDLAIFFETQTSRLNQTVRRNLKRFPEGFVFQLDKAEFETLQLQELKLNRRGPGGRQKLPLAFTQGGVSILSCLLNNYRAIEVGKFAVCAFLDPGQMLRFTRDCEFRFC